MTEEADSISAKTNRLEEIIDRLESGDVSLERADELYEEGQELLAELEADLDVGEGEVRERS